jgi:hypothetical protein
LASRIFDLLDIPRISTPCNILSGQIRNKSLSPKNFSEPKLMKRAFVLRTALIILAAIAVPICQNAVAVGWEEPSETTLADQCPPKNFGDTDYNFKFIARVSLQHGVDARLIRPATASTSAAAGTVIITATRSTLSI